MPDTLVALYVFVLACFIGYCGMGVTVTVAYPAGRADQRHIRHRDRRALLVSGLESAGRSPNSPVSLRCCSASINVFGGFTTNRMLAMFRKKNK